MMLFVSVRNCKGKHKRIQSKSDSFSFRTSERLFRQTWEALKERINRWSTGGFLLTETNEAVYHTNTEPLADKQTLGFYPQREFKRSKPSEKAAHDTTKQQMISDRLISAGTLEFSGIQTLR